MNRNTILQSIAQVERLAYGFELNVKRIKNSIKVEPMVFETDLLNQLAVLSAAIDNVLLYCRIAKEEQNINSRE